MAREAIALHIEGMAAAGELIPEDEGVPLLTSVEVEPGLPAAGVRARRRETHRAASDIWAAAG